MDNRVHNKDTVWHIFPNFIFNSLGGINFLLKCNFSVDKIPIKLASFDTIDSRSTIFFLTQLIILLGKYHIHAKKWAKAKPKLNIFLKKLNNVVLLCKILETEKRKRPMKHYVSLIWLIKYFYFFPGKDLLISFIICFIYIYFFSLYTLFHLFLLFSFYYCCEMYMFVLICT